MRTLSTVAVGMLLCLVSGCAMCSAPYDCHYPAYGGKRPRADMINGRVGSAFQDAGVQLASAESMNGEDIVFDENYMTEDSRSDNPPADSGQDDSDTTTIESPAEELEQLPDGNDTDSIRLKDADSGDEVLDLPPKLPADDLPELPNVNPGTPDPTSVDGLDLLRQPTGAGESVPAESTLDADLSF